MGNKIMRTMQKIESENKGQKIKIVEHIILRNSWEIYVIDYQKEEGTLFGLTYGDFTELGYTSEEEIKNFIICRSDKQSDLELIAPAPNWKWID